ncbi:MAG: type II secretion system F family protein [bacterium]|nr:type II secretion system F family protein [bacterium]
MNNFLKNLSLSVSLQEKIIFAKHLAIMIKAGMPLLDAINMLQQQTRSRSMSKILESVVKDVSNGQFLSKSLEKYQSVFGDLFIQLIKVGETGGILSENLVYLADELKKKAELRRKVVGALIYPSIILLATLGIAGFLTIYIFPKIIPVFSSLKAELPITTKILISISNLLTQHGGLAMLALLIIVIVIWFLLKVRTIRFYWHRVLLSLPIVGKIARSVNMANFSRALGLLLKSDVKIVNAINITAGTLSNLVYRDELAKSSSNIEKGEYISKYLMTRGDLFPIMFANMIAVGERTGNLSETLLYLAEFYENSVDDLTKNLSNVLEPVLMVAMGVIVGFVAISIITPIYGVTQTLSR